MKFKKYTAILSALMLIVSGIAQAQSRAGGDIVGGGNLKKLEELTRVQADLKKQLKDIESTQVALEVWMHSLDEKQRDKLLQGMFDVFVVPQIKSPQ